MTASDPHILYVGAVLPKRSETFVYREVLGLRARGVRVSVASVNRPESELDEPELHTLAEEAEHVYGDGFGGKLAVYRDASRMSWWRPTRGLFETPPAYWPKYLLQCEAGYALAYRLRGRGITHVHAHMAHVPATVAMSCAEALGVPFSFTGHAADLFRDRSALRTKLRRAAFVACISAWHRGFYREFEPSLTDERLPVVRCGVDVSEFTAGVTTEASGGGWLAVGRLVAKKGFDGLLRALAQVGAQDGRPHPGPLPEGEGARAAAAWGLTLVGDGPERERLEALARELGVMERVRFAGAQPNRVVREMMSRASAFVLPCREAADGDRDGIPVVLMEAMASGLPVVSGDLPTIRELVADNVSGLMVRPGCVDDLAGAMLRLSGDAALRSRLAAAGRRRVEEEFSLSVNLDRLESAFAAASHAASAPALPAGEVVRA
ncbi:MAG: glycosyltransferase family 4 protein [Planctomycetota bacterium]